MNDTRTQPTQSRAYGVLLFGIAAISMAAIFIRLAQAEGVPSSIIAGGRLFIAALILTPAVLRKPEYMMQLRGLGRFDLLLVTLSGFFLAMHFMAWVTSLEYTSVLISGVLVTTSPIWVALMEVFILRARLSRMVIAGLILAMTGGLIIGLSGGGALFEGADSVRGALLATTGAITVAAYLIIGRRLRGSVSVTPYIWSVYSIAALIIGIILIISRTPVTGYTVDGYLWVLACGLVPQLLGHSALNYALGYLPATYISLSTQTEPLLSALAAFIIFNEMPAWAQVIGGLVILSGVILATLGRSEARKTPPITIESAASQTVRTP
ncbi:MAG: DMT family transporter [Anaerolineaceae bacterium]|nr:MAG: DMT family transporter [Anaerolineaceae bacterium]